EAITVLEGLAASCPDVPRYRYRLARALLRALGGGEALAIANDAASRQRLLARARALAEELHAHAPDNVDYAKTLIEALTRGAASADADGDRAGAREALLRASAVCAAAAAGDASRIDLVDAHAVVLECLAEHQMDDGEDEAARATLDRALALVRPALEREARRPARRIAARALLTRSVTLRAAAGEHATALRELDELGELCDRARDRIEAAGLAATCARAADGEVRTGYVDRAFAILRREGAADALAALSSDPRFAVLRDDPRFAELQRAAAR
ncbi:MAG TPA: hypothetical protein VK081_00515, partial [Planctomycetota bacterium]|nr:hypothetical protein [Planctomycetota bacterium]